MKTCLSLWFLCLSMLVVRDIKAQVPDPLVRLVDGSNNANGRAEFYDNATNAWGTICGDSIITLSEGWAKLFCQELGLGDLFIATRAKSTTTGVGSLPQPVTLKWPDCNPYTDYTRVADCPTTGQNCNHNRDVYISCSVNGNFSDWSGFSECTATCGHGTQTRTRTCSNPAPLNGGSDCVGDYQETVNCINQECPVNGGWTEWSSFSICSEKCGTGNKTRNRTCTNPAPAFGGLACEGFAEETVECIVTLCPVWSCWSDFLNCSASCGPGNMTRHRTCLNEDMYNSLLCVGAAEETVDCLKPPCPINGNFSDWSVFSECTATCGNATRTRTRTCSNPPPLFGGSDCVGDYQETENCVITECPVHGGWTPWLPFMSIPCSVSCGNGTKTRTRTCSNPVPANNGFGCVGDSSETEACFVGPCPVNGNLSCWSEFTVCSLTCGNGSMTRTRTCTEPAPMYGGSDCLGDLQETLPCNEQPCPVDGGWSSWSNYSQCSVTCENGTATRTHTCTNPPPMFGGADCAGDAQETMDCIEPPCPVDGGWTPWSEYSECSVTCGNGTVKRTRNCTNPPPTYNGTDCAGDAQETMDCIQTPCPVSCEEAGGRPEKYGKKCKKHEMEADSADVIPLSPPYKCCVPKPFCSDLGVVCSCNDKSKSSDEDTRSRSKKKPHKDSSGSKSRKGSRKDKKPHKDSSESKSRKGSRKNKKASQV